MAGAHPEDVELLGYVEDELDSARTREIADHTRTCTACATQVLELEIARDAVRGAPVLRLPPGRRDRLVAELPAPRGVRRAGPRRLLALVAALVTVAAVLAVVATQNGPTVGGQGEEAAEQASPQTDDAQRDTETRRAEAAAGQATVAQVEAPPSRVVDFLRERGYDARVVDGSVEVRTKRPAAVRGLLNRRFARGDVQVYVR